MTSHKGIAGVLNEASLKRRYTRRYRQRVNIVRWPRSRYILWLIHRDPAKPSRSNKRYMRRHARVRMCVCVCAHAPPGSWIEDRPVSLAGYHADCRPVEMRLITCYEWVRLTVAATAAATERERERPSVSSAGSCFIYSRTDSDAAKVEHRTVGSYRTPARRRGQTRPAHREISK